MIGRVDECQNIFLDQCPRGRTHKTVTSAIRLLDQPAFRFRNQNRIRNIVKQEAIARFRLPQVQIIPLHRLLGFQQPLLQHGDGAQITPDCQHKSVIFRFDHFIADGYFTVFVRMIDLAPFQTHFAIAAEHLFDFGNTVFTDRIRPFLPNPLIYKAMIGRIYGGINDIPVFIDGQHEVTGCIGEFNHVVFGKAAENRVRVAKGNAVISWFQDIHRHSS